VLARDLQEPLTHHLSELAMLVRQRASFTPATARRAFRISSPDYAQAVAILPKLRQIQKTAPGLDLALLPADPARSWADMEDSAIELLVTSRGLTPLQAVARKLFNESFILAARKGHSLWKQKMTLDLFCALEQVLVSTSGGSFTGPVDDVLKSMGRKRRVAVSLASFIMVPNTLQQSDYIAVMPGKLAEIYAKDLKTTALPFAMPGFDVLISWHPKHQGDPAHRWLRERLIGQCAG
jgi:DNA-binding transcriptional LysR family regulator